MRPDLSEALRYLGVRGEPDPALYAELSAVADKLARTVTPRYVWRVFPVARAGTGMALEGTDLVLPGSMAREMLADCDRAVLLACTLGARFDARLLALQARDMAKAVIWDALGSAFVETGCNQAEVDISARFPDLYLTDRFSPGYGDLPLDVQPALCAALDAGRRLGVTVTPSLLMNPAKSVTAIIGLAAGGPPDWSFARRANDSPQPARGRHLAGTVIGALPQRPVRQSADCLPNDCPGGLRPPGCGCCNLRETCQFRKEGKTCGA